MASIPHSPAASLVAGLLLASASSPAWSLEAPYPEPEPCDAAARARAAAAPIEEFILGSQWEGSKTAGYLTELGVPWARVQIPWNSVQPVITDDTLTLADIDANPQLIDDLIDSADWTWLDSELRTLVDAGIFLFPVIAHGWVGTYALIDGESATPDRLGAETYLAYMYLYVRAVVERYDGDGDQDADGIVIKHWQIENELNQAMLTAVYGWREPMWLEGLTSLWADWDFLTELLQTLNRAVHDSDLEAITTQNLHTDVPPEYNHLFGMPGWIEAIALWRDDMDVMGFDAYPNYFYADPVLGEVVGERVQTLREQSCGKQVILMETGYPSGPEELGFSREKQAQYIDEAFHAAVDAGAVGYFHFKLETSETHSVEITEEDKQILTMIAHLYEQGRVLALTAWAYRNLEYIEEHGIDLLQSVEGYWGLYSTEGEKKPSFYTMQSIASELYGTGESPDVVRGRAFIQGGEVAGGGFRARNVALER